MKQPSSCDNRHKMHVTKTRNKDTVTGKLNSLTDPLKYIVTELVFEPRSTWLSDPSVYATKPPSNSNSPEDWQLRELCPSLKWRFQDEASVPGSRNEKEIVQQGHRAQRSLVGCHGCIPQCEPKLNSNSETLRTDRGLEMLLGLWLEEGSSREQTVTWEAMQGQAPTPPFPVLKSKSLRLGQGRDGNSWGRVTLNISPLATASLGNWQSWARGKESWCSSNKQRCGANTRSSRTGRFISFLNKIFKILTCKFFLWAGNFPMFPISLFRFKLKGSSATVQYPNIRFLLAWIFCDLVFVLNPWKKLLLEETTLRRN